MLLYIYLLEFFKNRLSYFSLLFKKSVQRHHRNQSSNHYDMETNIQTKNQIKITKSLKTTSREKATIKNVSLDLLSRVLKLVKRIISVSFHHTILNRANQLHKHIILQNQNRLT